MAVPRATLARRFADLVVMPALNRLSGSDAITAMQAINLQAPRSLLMLPLIGSLVGSAAVAAQAVVRSETPNRVWLVVGVVAGIIAFLITAIYHIPHNNALAQVNPQVANASEWSSYSTPWALWNHARTLAYLISGTAFVGAVLRRG